MIEHCISAFSERKQTEAYRIYVTDCLMYLNRSVSEQYGGSYKTIRYAEMVAPQKQDNRTGDEIAEDIIRRAGLKIGRGDAC